MKWLAGSVLGLALVLGSWASAQEVEREVRKLQKDIRVLSVLRKLDLSQDQRSKLVSIYRQFKALKEKHDKKLLGLLRKKRDLLLSGRASEDELIDLDGKIEQEKLMFRTEVRKLRAEAMDLLTPEQRRRLRGKLPLWPKPPKLMRQRAWGHPEWRHPPEGPPPGPPPEEVREKKERLFWRMKLLGEEK